MTRSKVNFYHLTRSSLFEALPRLLEKMMEKKLRVEVVHPQEDVLEEMDRVLWTYTPKSCLPHAMKGDPYPSQHPIWLNTHASHINKPQVIIHTYLDKEIDIKRAQHSVLFIDGQDSSSILKAREEWKRLQKEDVELTYWKQNDTGKWLEQKPTAKSA